MAFTYLILNCVFIILACIIFYRSIKRVSNAWLITLIALLILTLVFDNVMIALDIFGYAPNKILGVHIGYAPIEDFFYALLAAIIVPALWHTFKKES